MHICGLSQYQQQVKLLQVYKVKLWRVQMKNSARVSCAHLLKSPSTAEQSLFCKLVVKVVPNSSELEPQSFKVLAFRAKTGTVGSLTAESEPRFRLGF